MTEVHKKEKSFLIVDDAETCSTISRVIKNKYRSALIYTATSQQEAFNKTRNAIPSVIITELDLPKSDGLELIDNLKKQSQFAKIPIIIVTSLPEEDRRVQHAVSRGAIHLKKPFKGSYLIGLLEGIIVGKPAVPEFQSKALNTDQMLFKEGDESSSIFLVKKGKLRVFKEDIDGKIFELGIISENQLVGEMAFIDKKPRSANVMALEDTEVVELPLKDFSAYIESQPFWLKAMVFTLLDRLRTANNTIRQLSN